MSKHCKQEIFLFVLSAATGALLRRRLFWQISARVPRWDRFSQIHACLQQATSNKRSIKYEYKVFADSVAAFVEILFHCAIVKAGITIAIAGVKMVP